MKKTIGVLLGVLTILLAVSGCGMKSAALPNPVVEVTEEEMVKRTNLPLGVPAKAENIHYFVIEGEPVIGQAVFELDGKTYTFRVAEAKMEAAELSGVHFGKPTEAPFPIVKAEATLLTEGKTAVAYLLDAVPSITYTLTCLDCDDPHAIKLAAVDIFAPKPQCIEDMDGIFKDDDYDDVLLTEIHDSNMKATVGIFRLTTMEGSAVLTENGVDMTLTDASGGTLLASFNRTDDGTYTLTITNSTWPLLENGTEFKGFYKDSNG